MTSNEPLYLIDGNAYIYRAYHAIAPLTNSSGLPTHAIYGFTNILLRVIREKNPKYLGIAFDMKGPNFRHEIYGDYKANRPPMPEDLVCQIPYIKEIVAAFNITCMEQQGYEADDVLASAAHTMAEKNQPVILVSGDKDLAQMVSDKISVWEPMRDVILDQSGVKKKYNVDPEQLLNYFALVGDNSDNIPGVAGVGPKTAEKLINQFNTLEDLYLGIDEITQKKLKEKLLTNKENAFLSRKLIALKQDLTTPELAEYAIQEPDNDKLRELFTFLGFSRLLKQETTAPELDKKGFQLVRSLDQLQKLCENLKTGPLLVIDTETSSLDTLTAELIGISLCNTKDEAFYLAIGHRDEDGNLLADQLPLAEVLAAIQPLLADEKLPKLAHNLKFDLGILKTHGLSIEGPIWDSMIASYLIDPSRRSHKLDDLCREITEVRLTSFSEATKGDKRPDAFVYVEPETAKDYSCEDVIGALMLWEEFRPQLEKLNLWDLFTDLEMALVPILSKMERAGVLVDQKLLEELARDFGGKLDELETKIYHLAGEEFNINSPKQLGVIFFEKLNLPHGRKTKTGYSTDVKVLEKLAPLHELPATIMVHRNLTKLKSTYIDKLASLTHPKSGRVHTSFNQTVTATGRLSSSNPNLQNIPIRTPEGQRIRQAFIAKPDHLFLSADYSQIDLRVLAHYSQDEALLHAFRNDQDIHSQTAAEIFRVNQALIVPQMRRVAKTINFGIVYGMSAFGLASQLNISRKEAATFIERYFDHYSGVKRFMEEIIEKARMDSLVTTLLHRRRLLPDINSNNKTRREFAERTAINTPIQGTAADIIKLATIATCRDLKEKNLQAELLLQIHDELVFEVPESEIDTTGELVKQTMEQVLELDVPLIVNTVVGNNLAKV